MSKGLLVAGCLVGTLILAPASWAASLPSTDLMGCWQEDHTAAELADWDKLMAEPDAELLGMMSTLELCFHDDGTIDSIATGGFEGREAGGHFTIAGEALTVRSDGPDDAWYFIEDEVTCRLSLFGDAMHLIGCAGQSGALFGAAPRTFTRETRP